MSEPTTLISSRLPVSLLARIGHSAMNAGQDRTAAMVRLMDAGLRLEEPAGAGAPIAASPELDKVETGLASAPPQEREGGGYKVAVGPVARPPGSMLKQPKAPKLKRR